MVGYGRRQNGRRWAADRGDGLALVLYRPRPGKASHLSPEALAGPAGEMRAGRIAPLEDAWHHLTAPHGIADGRLNGVWWQLRKHKFKPMTVRWRHRRATLAALAGVKAGFRCHAWGGWGGALLR